jgi:hypothetical protein
MSDETIEQIKKDANSIMGTRPSCGATPQQGFWSGYQIGAKAQHQIAYRAGWNEAVEAIKAINSKHHRTT